LNFPIQLEQLRGLQYSVFGMPSRSRGQVFCYRKKSVLYMSVNKYKLPY